MFSRKKKLKKLKQKEHAWCINHEAGTVVQACPIKYTVSSSTHLKSNFRF